MLIKNVLRIEQDRLIKVKDTDNLLLEMKSDSDEPLSSLASLDYLRRENRQVRTADRRENVPSAAVSDVAGNGRTSVVTTNSNGGYRGLTGCCYIVVVEPRGSLGCAANRRAGALVWAVECHGTSIGETALKSEPGGRRVASRTATTPITEL